MQGKVVLKMSTATTGQRVEAGSGIPPGTHILQIGEEKKAKQYKVIKIY
jgi:hypothetical protein